jgi:hypothetical protein
MLEVVVQAFGLELLEPVAQALVVMDQIQAQAPLRHQQIEAAGVAAEQQLVYPHQQEEMGHPAL